MPQRPHLYWILSILTSCLGLSACTSNEQPETGAVEDLTIVVEADKSRIEQEESALQAQRDQLEEERSRLRKQQDDIANKMTTLAPKDNNKKEALAAAERTLSVQQEALNKRLNAFEAERSKLDAEKNKLMERITQMASQPAAPARTSKDADTLLARRESALAEREKSLAAREGALIQRMDTVTKLLTELDLCNKNKAAMPTEVAAAVPSENGMAKQLASKQLRLVQSKMEQKGILEDDLAGQMRSMLEQAKRSIANGQHGEALDPLSQLTASIDGMIINQSFVQGKMARMNRMLQEGRSKNLPEPQQKKLTLLLGEANESLTDGRFDRANKRINQMLDILR